MIRIVVFVVMRNIFGVKVIIVVDVVVVVKFSLIIIRCWFIMLESWLIGYCVIRLLKMMVVV